MKERELLLIKQAGPRFRARIEVQPDGCQFWIGPERNGRYLMDIDDVPMEVHRIAWVLEWGGLPEDKRVVTRCKVARCVYHLELKPKRGISMGDMAALQEDRADLIQLLYPLQHQPAEDLLLSSRRFHSHTIRPGDNDDNCLLWNSSSKTFTTHGGRVVAPRRFMYELYRGLIPDGHQVMSKCEVPGCIEHGEMETRPAKGSRLVDPETYDFLMREYREGRKAPYLAKLAGISEASVTNVLRNSGIITPFPKRHPR